MSARKRIVIAPKDKKDAEAKPFLKFSKKDPPKRTSIQSFLTKRLLWIGLGTAFILVFSFLMYKFLFKNNTPNTLTQSKVEDSTAVNYKKLLSNIDYSLYNVKEDILSEDTPLSILLSKNGFSGDIIAELIQDAQKKGVDMLQKGKEIRIFEPKDANATHKFFVYSITPDRLVEIKGSPFPQINIHARNIQIKTQAIGGIIKTNLIEAAWEHNVHYQVIDMMGEAMKWSVDLQHLNTGDKFKIIYDEKIIDEKVVGVALLRAVYIQSGEKEYYTFWVASDYGVNGSYLDENGHTSKRTFLKSPLRFGHLSSRYNLERLHPVLNTVRPHLGTDFAAPQGTPILAVGNGQVIAAAFTANNGNFIKIKHDAVYQTQYLHMSGFAPSMKEGSVVKQGDVIGFVGATGLATGPHVCFRFWKNGAQVDPFKENIDEPVATSVFNDLNFHAVKDTLMPKLKSITYFE